LAVSTLVRPQSATRAQWLAYLGCSFGIGVFNGFSGFTLPLWLSGFTSSYLLIGLLANTRSAEGAIVSPITCAWSDRAWYGWLGRRRAFVLVGGVLAGLALTVTPMVARLPVAENAATDLGRLAPAIIAIFVFTLLFNAMDDVHRALLADIADGPDRTKLAGYSVVAAAVGQVVILFGGSLLWRESVNDSAFLVTGALLALGAVVTVAGVVEPAPEVWADQRAVEAGDDPGWRTLVRLYPGAAAFAAVTFCYWTGANAVIPLLPLFARDVLGASVGQAQFLPGVLLLFSTLFAVPVSRLANRYGKRRVLAISYGLVLISALGSLLATELQHGIALFALAGVGSAAVLVLPVPIMADLVPRHRMGAATGLLAGSASIAAPLASVLAGAMADAFGLRAIFVVMVAFILGALAFLPGARRRG
jgi:MFS family permease